MRRRSLVTAVIRIALVLVAATLGATRADARTLLVLDITTNSVLRYDGTTGAFIDVFVSSGSGGLNTPNMMVFGPDGNLYVSSMNSHQVLKYNGASGAFLGVFAADAANLQFPSALAFGPDGNLYVANYNLASISRFDGTTGQFIDTFVPSQSGGIRSVTYMYFRADGYLYLSGLGAANDGRITRFDAMTGQFVDSFVSGRSVAMQDFVFDSGVVYGGFFHNNAGVEKYDATTGAYVGTLVTGGTGGLSGVSGMLLHTDGTLLVASARNGRVLNFDAVTGAFIREFVPGGSGGLQGPNALIWGPDPGQNLPPTAVSGLNQTVRPGTLVQLDGSGSFDDNTPTASLQFSWSFASLPPGSTVAFTDAGTASPSFTPDVLGNYVVRLVVTDEGGLSSEPSDALVGQNPPPTANAGLDQLVLVNQLVTLSGSASDADGDALTYQWSVVARPGGSSAQISNSSQLTATLIPDLPGAYVLRLTPSDFLGAGTSDEVTVTAITASYAETQIQLAAAVVITLPLPSVTSRGNQNALTQFLGNAVVDLGAGDLDAARHQLQQAIARTDGCALHGAPDGNGPGRDWIVSCTAQTQIYPLLVDALAAIVP